VEYIELNNDWVLTHDSLSVRNISFHESGKLWKSEAGNMVYFLAKTEAEINAEIERLGLRPKWEIDLPWQFEANYRFKIDITEAVFDPQLRALMDYIEQANVSFVKYDKYIVIYVNYFLQAHYDLLVSKGIDKDIEMNEGISKIDII
jgi:hypothetical protein